MRTIGNSREGMQESEESVEGGEIAFGKNITNIYMVKLRNKLSISHQIL